MTTPPAVPCLFVPGGLFKRGDLGGGGAVQSHAGGAVQVQVHRPGSVYAYYRRGGGRASVPARDHHPLAHRVRGVRAESGVVPRADRAAPCPPCSLCPPHPPNRTTFRGACAPLCAYVRVCKRWRCAPCATAGMPQIANAFYSSVRIMNTDTNYETIINFIGAQRLAGLNSCALCACSCRTTCRR